MCRLNNVDVIHNFFLKEFCSSSVGHLPLLSVLYLLFLSPHVCVGVCVCVKFLLKRSSSHPLKKTYLQTDFSPCCLEGCVAPPHCPNPSSVTSLTLNFLLHLTVECLVLKLA